MACINHFVKLVFRLTPALVLGLMASPAVAQAGTQVPEPSDLALFALGVIGLVIGRQGARRRRD